MEFGFHSTKSGKQSRKNSTRVQISAGTALTSFHHLLLAFHSLNSRFFTKVVLVPQGRDVKLSNKYMLL